MTAKGLAKLLEELAELAQVSAKKLAYMETDKHPDGAGSMKERLEDEMGDVLAAIDFVAIKLDLDYARIEGRKLEKLITYQEWDNQP